MAEKKRHGGARPNSGPKRGVKKINATAQVDARAKAQEEGYLLPHEILLRAANGEMFKQRKLHIIYHGRGPKKGQEKERRWIEEDYWPTVPEQIDAAKAAAPYYVPRLAAQTIGTDENTADALTEVMKQLASKLPG